MYFYEERKLVLWNVGIYVKADEKGKQEMENAKERVLCKRNVCR